MRIGILAVGRMPPNVEGYLLNLARVIGDKHEIDVIVDRQPPAGLEGAVRCLEYRFRSSSSGWRRLESALVLRRYVRERKPDVLSHVIDFETYGLAVTLAGRLTRVPTVVRYGGQVLEVYRLMSGAARYRVFLLGNVLGQIPLRFSTQIVALGPALRAELLKHGAPARRIAVVPQPVDASAFDVAADSGLRARIGIRLDARLILVIGRLEWLKGMETMLRVIPRVREVRPETWFCFVGDGPYADRLSAVPGVVVAGTVPRSAIRDFLKAADVLVHPSLTEGVANTLLEGLAARVPVISRDVGDAASVTAHLFTTEDELLGWLTSAELKAEPLPEIFSDAAIRQAYLELFERVARVRG